MKMSLKSAGVLTISAVACLAQAQVVYSNVTSSVAFTPSGTASIPWATQGSRNQIIDFFAGQVPVVVGDSSGHTTAFVNIIYEANTANYSPVSRVNMVIQGSVFFWGRMTWTETVEDLNNNAEVIGTAGGTFLGSNYSGGVDGPINFNGSLNLSHASTNIKVKKTFTLDIDGQSLPTTTFASLGLVEQVLVPEPATVVAVLGGIVALGLRRKSKK